MSAPYNKFAAVLEAEFLRLLQTVDAAVPASIGPPDSEVVVPVAFFTAKSEDPAICPRLVVAAGTGHEAIYQTGIYELPVKISVVTDIDTGSGDTANELFGRVMDVVQWADLAAQLMAVHTLHVFGFGTPKLMPNEGFNDRQWIESVEVPVFGFAL